MLRIFAPAALWALAMAAPAHAENDLACTRYIDKAPAVVNGPGLWCLANDISYVEATGSAVNVAVDDAILDCRGHKIVGSAASGAVTTHGVSLFSRHGITVRNCLIRGFQYGIVAYGENGRNNLFEGNRLTGNTYIGIYAVGDHSIVQRNEVFDTGGSTLSPLIRGIMTEGSVDVIDNTVAGVVGGIDGKGNAIGVYAVGNDGSVIEGNRVRDVIPGGTGLAFGIFNASPGWIVVRENDLAGPHLAQSIGLRCADDKGLAQGNAVGGFATSSVGCHDAGDNSYLDANP